MREIKFRGRTEEGEWLVGDLRQRMGYWPAIIEIYCTEEGKVGYREVAVEENTVGQYTGLKDKNGKEIYEGDIIQSIDSHGQPIRHSVEYEPTEAKFIAILDEHPNLFSGDISQRWIDLFEKETIGNIHDNPELLKKE